ncbi:MAG TPA: DUF5317 family protein [Atribacteraceae bacterium]|nr:DUF5317 family protein [Atribacteraceae bacterium]
MMLADFIIYGILAGWVTGGKLGYLKQIKMPFFWLIIVGFLVRYVVLALFPADFIWLTLVGMSVVFIATTLSYRLPGMLLIAAGTMCNIAVMAVNQGRMPVSLPLARQLGLGALVERFYAGHFPDYVAMTSATPLAWLGDIVPYYSLLYVQPFVVSIGDYLLGIGIIWFLVQAMNGRRGR